MSKGTDLLNAAEQICRYANREGDSMKANEFYTTAQKLRNELSEIYQTFRDAGVRLTIGLEVQPSFESSMSKWVASGASLRGLLAYTANTLNQKPPVWANDDQLTGIIIAFRNELLKREPKLAWKHQIADLHGVSTWVVGIDFLYKGFTQVIYWDAENAKIMGGSESSAIGAIFEVNITLDERIAIEKLLNEEIKK